jgi:branched-chain amino acid transport system substrate-binding protein
VNPASAADSIKIGAVASITGWAGFVGTPQKEALNAMADEVNRNGGINGRPLEILLEDDTSNPTTAVVAATKLIRDKGVCVLVGPSIVDSGMAMVPIVEQEKVSLVCPAPLVSPFKKWVFLVGPGDVRGASHTLEYAVKTLNAKRIALFHDSALFGTTGAKVITRDLAQYPGVSIVIEEKFEPGDLNMVPQLSKIKAASPDLILLYTTGNPAAVVAKNYKQLGMKIPVLGSGGIAIPDFLKNAGKIAEESKWAIFSQDFLVAEKLSPTVPFRKNIYDPFKKLLKDKYGPSKEVTVFHLGTHDGMTAIIAALKLAGTDERNAVRNAIEKVRVQGFFGAFACTPEDHQAAPKDMGILVGVKSGEYVPYKQ